MAKNKTPYTTIAKLSSGEKWLLGLLGVEITVLCTRTKYDGYISFTSHNYVYSGKGFEKIDSFSVKFSHEGTTQSNITDDDICLGVFSPFTCDSNYGKYGAEGISEASKIKTDVVDEIKTYQKPPFAPPLRSGIYFYIHSQKRDDDTIPKTFYRKVTLLSFTTTDGVVHSIDNLNY